MYSYLIICSFALLYEIVNFLFVTVIHDQMDEEYRLSMQPCIQVSGSQISDTALWVIYFWVGWVAWCYPFIYVVWPKKQGQDMRRSQKFVKLYAGNRMSTSRDLSENDISQASFMHRSTSNLILRNPSRDDVSTPNDCSLGQQ